MHQCYVRVSTILWLHHLEFNETHGEKYKWELYEDDAYCFIQILEAVLYKTTAVQLLTSYLTNHPSKGN